MIALVIYDFYFLLIIIQVWKLNMVMFLPIINIDLNKHFGRRWKDASRGANSCSEIEINETDGVDDGMMNEKTRKIN